MSADQPTLQQAFERVEGIETISRVVSPLFLFGSFALTVPYQLSQIAVVVKNMRTYEAGDSRRIKDPKTIILRRSLSAVGGVVGAIGCLLGTGIFFAVGGSLKIATGVMCLYTNARLFYEGYTEEQSLLKNGIYDQKALQKAHYKKIKGAAGFVSSAAFITYFSLTIAAGICPPVMAFGVCVVALSLLCAYLEKQGSQESYYRYFPLHPAPRRFFA